MKSDVCVLCGTDAVVSDPESKPPYVHLGCVLNASPKYDYPKIIQLDLGRPFNASRHGQNIGRYQPPGSRLNGAISTGYRHNRGNKP